MSINRKTWIDEMATNWAAEALGITPHMAYSVVELYFSSAISQPIEADSLANIQRDVLEKVREALEIAIGDHVYMANEMKQAERFQEALTQLCEALALLDNLLNGRG